MAARFFGAAGLAARALGAAFFATGFLATARRLDAALGARADASAPASGSLTATGAASTTSTGSLGAGHRLHRQLALHGCALAAGDTGDALGPLEQLAGVDAQDALAIPIQPEQAFPLAEAERLDQAGEAVLPLVEALVAGAQHGLGLAQVERPAGHGVGPQEHALHGLVAFTLQRRIGRRRRRTGRAAAAAVATTAVVLPRRRRDPAAAAVTAAAVPGVAVLATVASIASVPARTPRRRHAVRGRVGRGVEGFQIRLALFQHRARQDGELTVRFDVLVARRAAAAAWAPTPARAGPPRPSR